MGLPEYEPPKFKDGVYTHTIISELEDEYGIEIRFASLNARYNEEWDVWINQKPVMEIGRRRNDMGNSVYEMSSTEFRNKIKQHIQKVLREE